MAIEGKDTIVEAVVLIAGPPCQYHVAEVYPGKLLISMAAERYDMRYEDGKLYQKIKMSEIPTSMPTTRSSPSVDTRLSRFGGRGY